MTVATGQAFSLVVYLVFTALILVSVFLSKNRPVPRVREIAGLAAIEEAIGRATEMGRPVHYSLGIGGLVKGEEAPQTLSGVIVLGYVASLSARYNVRLIVTIAQPEVFPVASDVVKQSFTAEGHSDYFKNDTVRFIASNQFGYASGTMGLMQREKVAANIMMGYFAGESMILAGAGYDIGGIQIAGTAAIWQIPYFVVSCDYALIGEEIFIAGAVLSKDPMQLGSVRGQDLCKVLIWILLFCGVVSRTLGSKLLVDLMSK